MRAVRSKDTKPEKAVRWRLHAMGYRFRLHARDLPGTPDIVFRGRKKVLWIHGCFWHGHGCSKGRLPKSKLEFWEPKILANRVRDEKNMQKLLAIGWKVMIVWQCQIRNHETLGAALHDSLGPTLLRRGD